MRNAAIAVSAAAGALLLVAVLTKSWFTEGDSERGFRFGLWGACYGDQCIGESYNLEAARDTGDKAWIAAGRVTFVGGILGAGLLGLSALLFGVRTPQRLERIALVVAAIDVAAGTVFVILKPSEIAAGMSFGYPLLLIGGMAGMVGSALVAKSRAAPPR